MSEEALDAFSGLNMPRPGAANKEEEQDWFYFGECAPQNVWPTQKKLRVWMVWNEGMWGRALVLGRAYIMKNLLTTTTIAARGKVNFSWPKWHRLSDRLICVFSLCVLLESLMLELILKSDLETFLCQRADHPILIFKSRNSVRVFSVLAPAYFEEERTDNAFNSSEDD